MTLTRGDVVLVDAPFHQRPGTKVRPVHCLAGCRDHDFLGIPVISVDRPDSIDVPIVDLLAAGLNRASFARVHKVLLHRKSALQRRVGRLSPTDLAKVTGTLCNALCNQQVS